MPLKAEAIVNHRIHPSQTVKEVGVMLCAACEHMLLSSCILSPFSIIIIIISLLAWCRSEAQAAIWWGGSCHMRL